jgi:hypothetical protein
MELVEQLLQALVEAGPDRGGLAGPPPRHDPPPSFAELEREIAGAFPALANVGYPAALQALYAHPLPFLDCRLVRLVASPSGAPLRELQELVFNSWWPELIAGQGLLAVADEGSDGGPLCLDTRAGDSPETWPVVVWDHDWQRVTATPFSSTDRMLACVIHLLQGGKIADLAGIGPQGSATEYAFLDE